MSDTFSAPGACKLVFQVCMRKPWCTRCLLCKKQSLHLKGKGVKGRWQHPPADLCWAVELQLRGLLAAEEAAPHCHAAPPTWGPYQEHAPRSAGGWSDCRGEATEASHGLHHLF